MFPIFKLLTNKFNIRVYSCNYCLKDIVCGDKFCNNCGRELIWQDLFNYNKE